MPIRLGQQIHQGVDVLPGHIYNWEEDCRSGEIREKPVGIEIVRKLARKVRAFVQNLHLSLLGASHQYVRSYRLVRICRFHALKKIGSGIVDQKEVGSLRVVGAAGSSPGKINVGGAQNVLPRRALKRPIGEVSTASSSALRG